MTAGRFDPLLRSAAKTISKFRSFSMSQKMTPAELKKARESLGMTAEQMAKFLRVDGGFVTVFGWEAGRNKRGIPGPVQVLIEALVASEEVRSHFGLTLAK